MFNYLTGLVFDGLLPMFATLLSFLPQVVIMLTIVSLFENSGFTLGFSCTSLAVSAIEDSRSIKYKKRMTRFLTFIPCSAKLPALSFIAAAVLGWTIFGVVFLYVFAVFLGLLLGGFAVLEKPHLRHITVKELFKSITKNIIDFFMRISWGIIFAATILYTLQYFSLLLPISAIFEPIFMPLGFGAVAIACLIFGLVAKEMIIGAILTFGATNLGLTMAGSVSFILFVLLYTPCIPCLSAIKSKLGWKHSLSTAFFNFVVAYVISFIAYVTLTLLL